jgi:type I restriction enzyme M protein
VGTKKHATALVTEEFKGAICSNGFRVLRNFQLDIYFLLYFFQSEFFLKQMLMYRTGAAIPNVSNQDLKNILIYLPREDIINQISKKMKKYFNLKQNAKKELASIDFSFCINDN